MDFSVGYITAAQWREYAERRNAPDLTRVLPVPRPDRWDAEPMHVRPTNRQVVVIDGSGALAKNRDGVRRWAALRDACQSLTGGKHDAVILDPVMANRTTLNDKAKLKAALLRGGVLEAPAGTKGGVAWFLGEIGRQEGVDLIVIRAPGAKELIAPCRTVLARGMPGAWEPMSPEDLGPPTPNDGTEAPLEAPHGGDPSGHEANPDVSRYGGDLVTRARTEASLSTRQLAKRAGVDRELVVLVESREIDLPVSLLRRLLLAAGHSLELWSVPLPPEAVPPPRVKRIGRGGPVDPSSVRR